MYLDYKGKKTEEEIFELSRQYENIINYSTDKSLLIKGDNFKGLSGLLKEYKGKIDLIYIDPPFNTEQKFYVSNDRANTISSSQENATLAYDDTLTKDEYLEFLRERLFLMRELLTKEGSIYLHIDYKIGHYVKIIMDEVFGEKNFKNDITRIKSNPKNFHRKAYGNEKDLILFYAKNNSNNIWNDVREPMNDLDIEKRFTKIDEDGRRYTTIPLHAPGETKSGTTGQAWRGIPVPKGRHWRTNPEEFDKLDAEGKIEWSKTGNPRIKKYADEHKGKKIQDIWTYKDPQYPKYPTEKNSDMLEMIIKQSSREDSIVLDCFAGGGSTLETADRLGRRWIGIDSSIASIEVIRNSIVADYDFIEIKENL